MKIKIDLELKDYQKRTLIVVGVILGIAGIVLIGISFPWFDNDVLPTIVYEFIILLVVSYYFLIVFAIIVYAIIKWVVTGSLDDD